MSRSTVAELNQIRWSHITTLTKSILIILCVLAQIKYYISATKSSVSAPFQGPAPFMNCFDSQSHSWPLSSCLQP